MSTLISGISGTVIEYLVGIIGVIGTVFSVYLAGKHSGTTDQKLVNVQEAVANVKVRNAVENTVNSAGPGSAASELQSSWSRDGKQLPVGQANLDLQQRPVVGRDGQANPNSK